MLNRAGSTRQILDLVLVESSITFLADALAALSQKANTRAALARKGGTRHPLGGAGRKRYHRETHVALAFFLLGRVRIVSHRVFRTRHAGSDSALFYEGIVRAFATRDAITDCAPEPCFAGFAFILADQHWPVSIRPWHARGLGATCRAAEGASGAWGSLG